MDYKLTVYPALELDDTYKEFMFETKPELVAAAATAADLLLFLQDDAQVMENYSNLFICEEQHDGEWSHIE